MTTAYQDKVHAEVAGSRLKVLSALVDAAEQADASGFLTDAESLWNLVEKLESCAKKPLLRWRSDTGELLVSQGRCKSRLCPLCLRTRAWGIRCRLVPIIRRIDVPRHLTLTLKSSSKPLKHEVTRLTKAFAMLRRWSIWKTRCKGGFYVIEVTFNQKTGQWHPHIHAILDGLYIHHAQLRKAWIDITTDSSYLHVKRALSTPQVVNYLTAYLAKTSEISRYPHAKLPDFALAIRGQRLVSTFGNKHGIKLNAKGRIEYGPTELVAELSDLYDAADEGDREAIAIVQAIDRLKPPLQVTNGKRMRHDVIADKTLANRVRSWLNRNTTSQYDEFDPSPDPAISPMRKQSNQQNIQFESAH